MKYTVVSHTHLRILEEEVQEHLDNGWELQGGIAYAEGTGFVQALVLHNTIEDYRGRTQ